LTILLAQETRVWHDLITLDESWFYYITDHKLIWLPPDGKVPDLERVRIQSRMVMLTLESGCKFNTGTISESNLGLCKLRHGSHRNNAPLARIRLYVKLHKMILAYESILFVNGYTISSQ
jgi:hypothetical protein